MRYFQVYLSGAHTILAKLSNEEYNNFIQTWRNFYEKQTGGLYKIGNYTLRIECIVGFQEVSEEMFRKNVECTKNREEYAKEMIGLLKKEVRGDDFDAEWRKSL